MRRTHPRRTVLRAVGAGSLAALAGCLAGGEDSVESAREQLSAYADVATALEDGYSMSFPYVRDEDGVRGVPFVTYDVEEVSPDEPNVLWYDLREDGTFSLLGAKWFVRSSEGDEPPSLFGQEFSGPTPGETVDIPEHYGLTAWLFEDNPDGTFATAHTGVEPPSYVDELATAWEALTPYHSNEQLALDEGYAESEECQSTAEGDYGVPLVNTDSVGTDLASPAVLMYRFGSNWSYHLQGVEWYVPVEAVDEPPTLFGQTFHEPAAGHSPAFDDGEHYGLHTWLFGANPDGLFAPFNSRMLC